jgi:hypothetical protein
MTGPAARAETVAAGTETNMGRAAKNSQAEEFAQILDRIGDERVRYFYLMLGDAIAEASAVRNYAENIRANTSLAHIADAAARLNKA